jgi:CRISPR-associated endonuclease Csy4
MKHFIEITLLPTLDAPIYFLWEKVYQQIHLALVETKDTNGLVPIGVSFPEYSGKKHTLGSKIRLFATSTQLLDKLDICAWLSRLTDYVHISKVRNVPEKTKHAVFKRVQTKSSNARLARRKTKREDITYDEALIALGDREEGISKAPYIHINSRSSEQRYLLLIDCVSAEHSSEKRTYNTYGLSSESSVPVF